MDGPLGRARRATRRTADRATDRRLAGVTAIGSSRLPKLVGDRHDWMPTSPRGQLRLSRGGGDGACKVARVIELSIPAVVVSKSLQPNDTALVFIGYEQELGRDCESSCGRSCIGGHSTSYGSYDFAGPPSTTLVSHGVPQSRSCGSSIPTLGPNVLREQPVQSGCTTTTSLAAIGRNPKQRGKPLAQRLWRRRSNIPKNFGSETEFGLLLRRRAVHHRAYEGSFGSPFAQPVSAD